MKKVILVLILVVSQLLAENNSINVEYMEIGTFELIAVSIFLIVALITLTMALFFVFIKDTNYEEEIPQE